MKSEDIQKIVFGKFQNGDCPTKIYNDLNKHVSLSTIKRWCKQVRQHGEIKLLKPKGRPRSISTKKTISNIKKRLKQKKKSSERKLAREFKTSKTTIHRILKNDLKYRAYKKRVVPAITGSQKIKRKKFANWVQNNFRKDDTMRILFSDEKLFDIDGVFNSQNDRVWAINRDEADKNGGIVQKKKFSQKVMVWLGVCSKGLTPLVIFDGTVNHEVYIEKALHIAKNYGNNIFGEKWTFQQDGATPHTHHLTQQWCRDNLPSFIDKDHWPPNSPDLNPLDYCIWNELVNAMDWCKISSKDTLIQEIKKGVKKISKDVILKSCDSWTKRLNCILKNDGCYITK